MSIISSSAPSDSSCSSYSPSSDPFVIIRGDSPLLGFDDDSEDPLHFPSPDYPRTLPHEPFQKSDWALPPPPSVVPGLHKRASAVSLHKSQLSQSLRHTPSSDFTDERVSYPGFAHRRPAPVDAYLSPSHTSGPTSDHFVYRPVDHTVHTSQHVLPPKTHSSLTFASDEGSSGWSDPPSNLLSPSPSATESTRRGAFRSGKSLFRLGTKKSVPEPQSSQPASPKAPKAKKRMASLLDMSLEVYSTYT